MSEAVRRARELENCLACISAAFQDICPATCSRCPEPCCLGAGVWFDYRDLIFFHLTGRLVPPAQPMARMAGDGCRYLGARGCRLGRLSRPWICTWYVCPTQTRRLRRDGDPAGLLGMVGRSQSLRKEMAAHFIGVVRPATDAAAT